jgi:hypothetical protein
MYRSQMHMHTLHRQLQDVQVGSGEVRFLPGELTVARYRKEFVLQLSVETILASEVVRARIEGDFRNLQVGYDVVYYLSRQFLAKGKTDWRLPSPVSLKKYLVEQSRNSVRNSTDRVTKATRKEASREDEEAENDEGELEEMSQMTDTDVKFWRQQIAQQAEYLAEPESLRAEWLKLKEQASGTSGRPRWIEYINQVNAVIADVSEMPKLIKGNRWLIDRYFLGPSKSTTPGGDPEARAILDRQVKFIEKMAEFLRHVSPEKLSFSDLGAGTGILEVSPAWPEVERALVRVKSGQPPSNLQWRTDRESISQFSANLERDGEHLAHVLYGATILGQWRRLARDAERLRNGLQVISGLFSLRDRRIGSIHAEIQSQLERVAEAVSVSPQSGEMQLTSANVDEWCRRLTDEISRAAKSVVYDETRNTAEIEVAWNHWYARFWNDTWETEALFIPTPEELLAAASGQGPSLFLDTNTAAMTLRRWSRAFLCAISDIQPGDNDYCPFWLAAPALRELRFARPVLDHLLELISDVDQLGYRARNLHSDEELNVRTYDPERWATLAGRSRPSVLIVGTDLAGRWLSSKSYGALVLTPVETLKLLATWPDVGSPLGAFDFSYVVFELSGEATPAPQFREIWSGLTKLPPSRQKRDSRKSEMTPAFISQENVKVPSDLLGTEPSPQLIFRPKNLNDLFRRLSEPPLE